MSKGSAAALMTLFFSTTDLVRKISLNEAEGLFGVTAKSSGEEPARKKGRSDGPASTRAPRKHRMRLLEPCVVNRDGDLYVLCTRICIISQKKI